MTQSEFQERTGVQVSWDEYWTINEVYNHFAGDKDEFCAWWCKCNKQRVAEAKAKKKAQEAEMKRKEKAFDILCKLERKVNLRNYWQPSTKFLGERMKWFLRSEKIPFGDDVMIMTVQHALNKIVRSM